jgi:hypothetical protein
METLFDSVGNFLIRPTRNVAIPRPQPCHYGGTLGFPGRLRRQLVVRHRLAPSITSAVTHLSLAHSAMILPTNHAFLPQPGQ